MVVFTPKNTLTATDPMVLFHCYNLVVKLNCELQLCQFKPFIIVLPTVNNCVHGTFCF